MAAVRATERAHNGLHAMTDAAGVSAPPLPVLPDVGRSRPVSDSPVEDPKPRMPPIAGVLVPAGSGFPVRSALVARQLWPPEPSNADVGSQRAGNPGRRFVTQAMAEIAAQNNGLCLKFPQQR